MSRSNAVDTDMDKARCRSQAVVLDVPLDPVVQENEVLHDSTDASSRKVGPKVMAEKVAGSGVFFRAFVKASKADRVLLYFPEDTDPCILEWVYKVSSRIYRANSSAKSTWKYQGNGAWKLTEKSKKKPKGCKRGKAPHNQQAGGECGVAAASPPSPECADEDEPDRKKRSQNGDSTAPGEPMGLSIESPWVETPISIWFRCHLRLHDESSKAAQVQASTDSRGPSGNPARNTTPQGSADDACHSTQHVEEAMLSVDSADHQRDHSIRLSCTGLDDSQHLRRLGDQACRLRFERDFEDDGSNSDAMPHNSPSASGCDPAQDNAIPISGKHCESHAWSQGSPSNASGDEQIQCFKTTKYTQLPSTASLSDYSCEAFQSCR